MDIHTSSPLFAKLGEFLGKGVMSEQSFDYPKSFNTGEFEGRLVTGGNPTYKLTYFDFHGRGSAFCFMF
tara:strand:- start:670 stop:876 length:207 start_codon:yes stop_codon:yes gene_type:complete